MISLTIKPSVLIEKEYKQSIQNSHSKGRVMTSYEERGLALGPNEGTKLTAEVTKIGKRHLDVGRNSF